MQLFLLGKLNENSKVIRNYANRLFICIMVLETSREKKEINHKYQKEDKFPVWFCK